jgi:hypothetical protein
MVAGLMLAGAVMLVSGCVFVPVGGRPHVAEPAVVVPAPVVVAPAPVYRGYHYGGWHRW